LAASKGPLPTLSRKGKGNLKELRAVIDRNEAAGWQNRVEVELPYVLGHENVGWVGNYTELSELTTLNAEGKVKLHTQRYPLDDVGTAVSDLERGRIKGRGVLIPNGAGSPGAAREATQQQSTR
jgi:hypothetical protein